MIDFCCSCVIEQQYACPALPAMPCSPFRWACCRTVINKNTQIFMSMGAFFPPLFIGCLRQTYQIQIVSLNIWFFSLSSLAYTLSLCVVLGPPSQRRCMLTFPRCLCLSMTMTLRLSAERFVVDLRVLLNN